MLKKISVFKINIIKMLKKKAVILIFSELMLKKNYM